MSIAHIPVYPSKFCLASIFQKNLDGSEQLAFIAHFGDQKVHYSADMRQPRQIAAGQ
jgi:hypothetical protein